MGKEMLTFGGIETKKYKLYRRKKSYLFTKCRY